MLICIVELEFEVQQTRTQFGIAQLFVSNECFRRKQRVDDARGKVPGRTARRIRPVHAIDEVGSVANVEGHAALPKFHL